MEENHQAELRQRDFDMSRLEEQLAQCHIQQNIPVSIFLSNNIIVIVIKILLIFDPDRILICRVLDSRVKSRVIKPEMAYIYRCR